jgi:hypothetical protein
MRLINVGDPMLGAPPRLIHTAQSEPELRNERYIALSHRWDSNVIMKLTLANVAHYQREIPLDNLPATFKDMLHLTRCLNVQYVWIDSLCIIQDLTDDWLQESAMMGKVYLCLYCNVAATAGADGSRRLFIDRDSSLAFPTKINISWKGHQQLYYFFPCGRLWHNSVIRALMNHQGWVL